MQKEWGWGVKSPYFSHALASLHNILPFSVQSILYSQILRIVFVLSSFQIHPLGSLNEDLHRLRLQLLQASEGV